jgi:uncharacterized membrane protein (UPF0127 family)
VDPERRTRLTDRTRRAAGIVVAVGIIGALVLGANRPANPSLVAPGVALPSRIPGIDQTAFVVQAGPGLPAGAGLPCALYARAEAQRQRGLMGRRSLDGYAGMIFAFPRPTTTRFYMKDTTLPLSIAWFDQGGTFVSETDMAPCPPHQAACPEYAPAAAYSLAIEVPRGQLPALGIGPGSTLRLDGPCTG